MRAWLCLTALLFMACGRSQLYRSHPSRDAGDDEADGAARDSGSADAAAFDAGTRDAGATDAGAADAGATDGGRADASAPDAGPCPGVLGFQGLAPAIYTGMPTMPIALTDVTGDGRPDVVAADWSGVVIAPGLASGGFGPVIKAVANGGNQLSAAVAGDFNGDGKPDVAFINDGYPAGTLYVALATASGFGPATSMGTAPLSPTALNAVDLDHDGHLDLVASGGSSAPQWWRGNGDGSFQPATGIVFPSTATAVLALWFADFNGDGVIDFVDSAGELLLGDGHGAFSSAGYVPGFSACCPNFNLIGVGDVNGDGRADVVGDGVSTQPIPPGQVMMTWLGQGDGTFSNPVQGTASGGPSVVMDLDGDGRADLLSFDFDTWTSYLAGPTGALQQADQGWRGPGGGSLGSNSALVGDVNGDGIPDLVVGDDVGMAVLLGKGRTFYTKAYEVAVRSELGVAVADFDGDGRLDVLAGSYQAGFTLLLGDGAGHLNASGWTYAPSRSDAFATGDFDGDGLPDLAIAEGPNIEVLPNQGGGRFGRGVTYPSGAVVSRLLRPADVDGDGRLDLVFGDSFSSVVGWLHSMPSGFMPPAPLIPPNVAYFDLGDANSDGRLDLFAVEWTTGSQATLATWLQDSQGAFVRQNQMPLGVVSGLAAIDGDGHGRPGALVLASGGLPATLTYYPTRADGTLAPGLPVPVMDQAGTLAAGNVDNDGLGDAFLTVNGVLQVTRDVGAAPSMEVWLPSVNQAIGAQAADLNRDGWPDLVLPTQGGSVVVMLSECR